MQNLISSAATPFGFVVDGLGAHSSRTIMSSELELLLKSCSSSTDLDRYQSAIRDDNVLLKRTDATRRESFRRLRELYGLTNGLVIFRALRDLWDDDEAAHAMLALLCSVARDPMLRATSSVILTTSPGEAVTPHMLAAAVDEQHPGRLNKTTLANIGRHAASSWKQSGHLEGRLAVARVQAHSHPTSVTYALLLGYLCGARGEALFQTGWAQMLDAPPHVTHEQAFLASQRGWLEYRHTGTVTDISFSHLLREEVRRDERG